MKRISSFLLGTLLCLLVAPVAQAAPAPDDLVGWWKLDEEANSTVVVDSSNSPANGVFSGAKIDQEGLFGRSYKFDGTNDYVEVVDPGTTSKFDVDLVTLEAWIKLDEDKSGFQNIVRKGHHGDRTYGLDLDNGKLRGFVNKTSAGGGTATIATDSDKLPLGKWIHVAMTYDGTNLKIYVDGQLEKSSSTVAGNIYDNNLSIRIGGQKSTDTGGALAFKGWIDEVRIWKVALTQDELLDNFDGVFGDADFCPNTTAETEFTPQAVNRWWWNGTSWGSVQNEGKKSKKWMKSDDITMKMTHGCSCTQILDKIEDLTRANMEGHRKFGCSKSVIEDFIADVSDGTFDGLKHLEEVMVPNDETVITTTSSIDPLETYVLRARGTYKFANWAGEPKADAKCSYRGTADPLGLSDWVSGDLLPAPYKNFLEVRVNGEVSDWGVPSGTCNSDTNIYTKEYSGENSFDFRIYDGGAVSDNSGNIYVDIFAKLY